MRERAVKSGETAFFASIYLLQRCLQNRRGKNQEYPPKFSLVQLRSTESGWNNVGKLEIVFRRAFIFHYSLSFLSIIAMKYLATPTNVKSSAQACASMFE